MPAAMAPGMRRKAQPDTEGIETLECEWMLMREP
jgi:hypothetical protein